MPSFVMNRGRDGPGMERAIHRRPLEAPCLDAIMDRRLTLRCAEPRIPHPCRSACSTRRSSKRRLASGGLPGST